MLHHVSSSTWRSWLPPQLRFEDWRNIDNNNFKFFKKRKKRKVEMWFLCEWNWSVLFFGCLSWWTIESWGYIECWFSKMWITFLINICINIIFGYVNILGISIFNNFHSCIYVYIYGKRNMHIYIYIYISTYFYIFFNQVLEKLKWLLKLIN